MPITILHTTDGVLDGADQQVLAALKERIARNPSQVLLHLHGGLVSEQKGNELAARLSGTGPNALGFPPAWEQVFVVWRTGLWETVRANWLDLATNDRIYRALLKRLLGYLSSKLRVADATGRSVGALLALSPSEIERRLRGGDDNPFGDVDKALAAPASGGGRGAGVDETPDYMIEAEFRTALQLDPEFTSAVEDLDAALNPAREGRGGASGKGDALVGSHMLDRLDPGVREHFLDLAIEASGRGVITSTEVLKAMVIHGAKIAIRVVKRFKDGRSHGFQATVVEELARELYGDIAGATIWGMMKKDAVDHFKPGSLGPCLVDALGAAGARLHLTAHSAGAIWVTALLSYLADQQSALDLDVVFLAPAVRVNAFGDMLAKATPRIRRFRSFAMSDEWEATDPVLGAGTGPVYPSSLLYMVSGLFEERCAGSFVDAPILGMQRFFPAGHAAAFVSEPDEQEFLKQAAAYLAMTAGSTCYSPCDGGDGLQSRARSHGGFDTDPWTLASARQFLA